MDATAHASGCLVSHVDCEEDGEGDVVQPRRADDLYDGNVYLLESFVKLPKDFKEIDNTSI